MSESTGRALSRSIALCAACTSYYARDRLQANVCVEGAPTSEARDLNSDAVQRSSNAWFGGRRQKPTDLKVTIDNQVYTSGPHVLRSASPPATAAYAAHTCFAAASVRFVPPTLQHQHRLCVPAAPDAPGQRDCPCAADQIPMERRRSALLPLTSFACHGAWLSRASHEEVPPHVDDRLACQFQP